jgi:hypothetical protein
MGKLAQICQISNFKKFQIVRESYDTFQKDSQEYRRILFYFSTFISIM